MGAGDRIDYVTRLGCERVFRAVGSEVLSKACPIKDLVPSRGSLTRRFGADQVAIGGSLSVLTGRNFVCSEENTNACIEGGTLTRHSTLPMGRCRNLARRLKTSHIGDGIVSFGIAFPSRRVRRHLKVGTDSPICRVGHLHLYSSGPCIFRRAFVPVEVIPGLARSILERSICSFLRGRFNFGVKDTFEHVSTRGAARSSVSCLRTRGNSPVLRIIRIICLRSKHPLRFSYGERPCGNSRTCALLSHGWGRTIFKRRLLFLSTHPSRATIYKLGDEAGVPGVKGVFYRTRRVNLGTPFTSVGGNTSRWIDTVSVGSTGGFHSRHPTKVPSDIRGAQKRYQSCNSNRHLR